MKSYLFVFNGGSEEREALVKIIDNVPEINAWRYDMVSCFYFLSNHTARQIAESIKREYPSLSRHVITKLGDEYWGELTERSWKMLEKCEYVPEPKS